MNETTPRGAPGLTLRFATPDDVPLVLAFIHKLATYEKLAHEVVATEPLIADALFGEHPVAEVVLAHHRGEPAGFALFFRNFSSYLGRPGIHIEDLFVEPALRGNGIARRLLGFVARLALERGCGRLEWGVLDWDDPAVRLYGKTGAEALSEWSVYRVSGEALERLAAQAPAASDAVAPS